MGTFYENYVGANVYRRFLYQKVEGSFSSSIKLVVLVHGLE